MRRDGYEANYQAISDGCKAAKLTVNVVGCSWGEQVGITTDLVDETLPLDATRAAFEGQPQPADKSVALWELLVDDPLFELRLAEDAATAPAGGFAIGELPPGAALTQRIGELAGDPGRVELDGTGIGQAELAKALKRVGESPELTRAAQAVEGIREATVDELADAVARAVVASLLAEYRLAAPGEAPPIAYSAASRDALVAKIAKALDPGGARGLGDWLKKKSGEFVARRATNMFAKRREKTTVGSLPFLGDILYYQKRGDEIRKVVADAIAKAKPPVVALGHSLGGIVLVDLLTSAKPPEIAQLVTVGSQSPLFYAIDALDSMRRHAEGPKPKPFTPWLNIYDRADFLSFVAGKVFPQLDISDKEISSGVPFPMSHSAYFHQPQTFELIGKVLPT